CASYSPLSFVRASAAALEFHGDRRRDTDENLKLGAIGRQEGTWRDGGDAGGAGDVAQQRNLPKAVTVAEPAQMLAAGWTTDRRQLLLPVGDNYSCRSTVWPRLRLTNGRLICDGSHVVVLLFSQ